MITSLLIAIAISAYKSSPSASSLPRISAHNTHLYSGTKPIVLKTINLGGWLVNEMWMTPWVTTPPKGSKSAELVDDYSLWHEMESRFGQTGMAKVRNAWRKDWITENDIQAISKGGFTGIRVPFRDELLHEGTDAQNGIKWLDWIVREAKKYHLYVILDMHGAPGGQSKDQPTGHQNQNFLWTNKEDQNKMLNDWKMLAIRYKNEPTVAMFDLMNEPMGAKSSAELYKLYDRLIKEVRRVNEKTILLVEDGYKGFENAPSPKQMNWKNVCFSLHFYNFDAKAPEDHLNAVKGDIADAKKVMETKTWPLYVGEFNLDPFSTPQVLSKYVDALEKAGFSWGYWTWKVYGPNGLGDWGIVRPKSDPTRNNNRPNPFIDSVSQLIHKLDSYKTSSLKTDFDLIKAMNWHQNN